MARVLILGGKGRVGRHAAAAFGAAGWEVARFVRGTDMTAAAMGAQVIVNGLNPPDYHDWARQIPRITAEVIAAAKASGARVIVPGNVYNYGVQPAPWDAATPQVPCSRKGQIRVEMEAALRASGVPVVILRAGNFIDPEGTDDIMSRFILKDIAKGRVTRGGRADVPLAWAYLPDWARAATELAQMGLTGGLSTWEDVPFSGHTFSMEEMTVGLENLLGRPLTLGAFPWWQLRLAAPFWELARELLEMRYLWSHPHSLSGARLRTLLPGFTDAPMREVLAACLPAQIRPDEAMRPGGKAILA